MEWECIECEKSYYDGIDGDGSERMCNSCLNGLDNDDVLNAIGEYVKHLRETGEINNLWDNFDNETKEAIRVLISTMGEEINEEK